jgi:hypothetical protein
MRGVGAFCEAIKNGVCDCIGSEHPIDFNEESVFAIEIDDWQDFFTVSIESGLEDLAPIIRPVATVVFLLSGLETAPDFVFFQLEYDDGFELMTSLGGGSEDYGFLARGSPNLTQNQRFIRKFRPGQVGDDDRLKKLARDDTPSRHYGLNFRIICSVTQNVTARNEAAMEEFS